MSGGVGAGANAAWNAHALYLRSAAFWDRLEELKRKLPPLAAQAGWYPYCSLANFEHFVPLLGGPSAGFAAVIAAPDQSEPLLDIGCADGDLAFFLESLGLDRPVHALDHAGSNHNGLAGIRALKHALASRVEILDVNLDEGFELPARPYAAAFCLGLLYHVKNPFHLLESLSRYARTCLLSTRVMRAFPGGERVPPYPAAYLLDAEELNADPTNFWIFNEAGLRRLASRAGWHVERYYSTARGDAASSDPDSLANDERAFCLLRARRWLSNIVLGQGWHEESPEGWRWTAHKFSFTLPPGRWRELSLSFHLPGALFAHTGAVTLSAHGIDGSYRAEKAGSHVWRARLPESFTQVGCEVDRWLPPSVADARELAMIVNEVDYK